MLHFVPLDEVGRGKSVRGREPVAARQLEVFREARDAPTAPPPSLAIPNQPRLLLQSCCLEVGRLLGGRAVMRDGRSTATRPCLTRTPFEAAQQEGFD